MKIYFADFRASSHGGGVVPGRLLRFREVDGRQVEQGTANELALEHRVTFLLHGFNVNRPAGRDALYRLAERLPGAQSGALVAVLWPGDGRFVSTLSYTVQIGDANDSAAQLSQFIRDAIRPGASLSFVSHSLGARVVLGTVDRLRNSRYTIDQICLLAAAIDDNSVANPDEFRAAVTAARRVAVLASRRDRVLRFVYQAGENPVATIFTLGASSFFTAAALGFHGPREYSGFFAGNNPVPPQVLHEQISNGRTARHADYLPASPPSRNQQSAASFADEVLDGTTRPRYP